MDKNRVLCEVETKFIDKSFNDVQKANCIKYGLDISNEFTVKKANGKAKILSLTA
jgi:hypothetical protein